jgi:hypothetical protein
MAVKGTDPPLCRTCGERHSFRDGCKPLAPVRTVGTRPTRAIATESNHATLSKVESVASGRRGGARDGAGRKRTYDNATDRKRAWRERRKAGA